MRARATLCAMLLASSAAAAQDTRVVTGFVRDSATGAPLVGALVALRNADFERTARSNQLGAFRIVAPLGDFQLNVRRIGYAEAERALRTIDGDSSVVLRMARVVRELDTVRVRERVMAIHGVIGTASGVRPLPGVKVQLIGVNRSTTTDSTGQFFFEVKRAGNYLVRVSREGYAHMLLSVDVPPDTWTETSALLDTAEKKDRMGTETAWNDFDRRLIWRGPRSAVVGGAELDSLTGLSVSQAVNRSTSAFRRGMRIGAATCVFVNGLPRPGWTVDAFDVDRIEAIELYGAGSSDATGTLQQAWPRRVPCGLPQGGANGVGGLEAGTAAWAVVWLKP